MGAEGAVFSLCFVVSILLRYMEGVGMWMI